MYFLSLSLLASDTGFAGHYNPLLAHSPRLSQLHTGEPSLRSRLVETAPNVVEVLEGSGFLLLWKTRNSPLTSFDQS